MVKLNGKVTQFFADNCDGFMFRKGNHVKYRGRDFVIYACVISHMPPGTILFDYCLENCGHAGRLVKKDEVEHENKQFTACVKSPSGSLYNCTDALEAYRIVCSQTYKFMTTTDVPVVAKSVVDGTENTISFIDTDGNVRATIKAWTK